MIRIALKSDVPAILAIYGPYILTTTATFEYDVPTEAAFLQRFETITAQFPWLVWEENGEILAMLTLRPLTAVPPTSGAPSLLCICIRMLVAKASAGRSMPLWKPF